MFADLQPRNEEFCLLVLSHFISVHMKSTELLSTELPFHNVEWNENVGFGYTLFVTFILRFALFCFTFSTAGRFKSNLGKTPSSIMKLVYSRCAEILLLFLAIFVRLAAQRADATHYKFVTDFSSIAATKVDYEDETETSTSVETELVGFTNMGTELYTWTEVVTDIEVITDTGTELGSGTEVVTDIMTEVVNDTGTELDSWTEVFTDIVTEVVTDTGTELDSWTKVVTDIVTEVLNATDAITEMATEAETAADDATTIPNKTEAAATTAIMPTTMPTTTDLLKTEPPTTRRSTTTVKTTRRPTEPPVMTMTPKATPSPTEEKLEDLKETPITEENVEEVSEELANLTSNSNEMSSDGVEDTVDILQNITALNSTEPEVTTAVVETVSNLMDVSEDELEQAAEEGATNDAIQALESQLSYVNLTATNGTYTEVDSNIGVQVTEYPPEKLNEGLTFSYATSDPSEELNPEDLSVKTGEGGKPAEAPVYASLSLPPTINDVLGGDAARISFVVYRDSSLFISRWLLDFNKNQSFQRRANTAVISAAVDGVTVKNLSDPVVTEFKPLAIENGKTIEEVNNPICVFWDVEADEGRGNWSTDGCYLLYPDDINNPTCMCNHLTNFAILMDVYGGENLNEREEFILEVLSYVFCCLSIVCLLVTLATFCGIRKLRKSQPTHILMALSASLIALYLMFIVLASVRRFSVTSCGVVVGLLHFSLMASICWMAVESFNMYMMVIKVFDRGGIDRFMWKAASFAFGAPAVIVALTAGIAQGDYMKFDDITETCYFLSKWAMVGGVLVPIATVIAYDTIIFVMVMRRLSQTVAGKHITQPQYKERLQRLQNAVALIVLMGLTWAFGFLIAIESASFVFQVVFTVLNALQGVFLFLFYCLRNPAARQKWRGVFCPCLPPLEERSTLSSSSSRSKSHSRNHGNNAAAADGEVKWYDRLRILRGSYDLTWQRRDIDTTLVEMSWSNTTSSGLVYKPESESYNDNKYDDGDKEFLPKDLNHHEYDDQTAFDNPAMKVGVETSFADSDSDREGNEGRNGEGDGGAVARE